MTTGGMVMCVPLVGLLASAAVVDVRTRRIPNWLTFGVLVTGLAQSFTASNAVGPADAGLGLLTGFGLTFALFAIGALGGGDVKLLAGVGAWLGPKPTLQIFALAAIFGMVIVLVQAARQGRLKRLFQNSAVIACSLAHAGGEGGPTFEQAAETGKACSEGAGGGKPLPYAVPVFFAAAILLARL
jgi:prepilin peptidase CpaA